MKAKNIVFYLIPALTDVDAGEDVAYLKILRTATEADVIDVFKSIVESQKLISEEDVDYFFDKKRFDTLYKMVKDKQNSKAKNRKRPSDLAPLLSLLDNIKHFPDSEHSNFPIIINGDRVEKGLVNTYSEYKKDNNIVLVNNNALDKPNKPLKICTDVDNPQRAYTNVEVFSCEKEKLYTWLCNNRQPRRIYDTGYEKHSNKVRNDTKGRLVSAMSYSDNDVERLLQWALRANKVTHTELYLLDVEEHKLIIFYDENQSSPTFHGHEIDERNTKNWESAWRRIRERGKKTKLERRLECTADIIKQNRESIIK